MSLYEIIAFLRFAFPLRRDRSCLFTQLPYMHLFQFEKVRTSAKSGWLPDIEGDTGTNEGRIGEKIPGGGIIRRQ